MSAKTGIQWTDATWNPMMGCRRVSAGCENCYAERIAARFSGEGQPFHDIARRRSNGEAQWTGNSAINLRTLTAPLSWRRPRRIFVNSMSDVFYEQFSAEDVASVWAVMALAPYHVFQLLTKRPERMREMLTDPGFYDLVLRAATEFRHSRPRLSMIPVSNPTRFPYANVWLGVSVENQETANERVPLLAQTPAAVRFLSCEPLLGPIDFDECGSRGAEDGDPFAFSALAGVDGAEPPIPGIDWCIIGGESGPRARPFHLEWCRDILAQCDFAGTAAFVKQLGASAVDCDLSLSLGERMPLRDSHGGDMAEWPEELRVREFPIAAEATV
jgi:protein gp37